MNQIFNEIDHDLKQDRFLNFIKKYKFVFIIIFSIFFFSIIFTVVKNIIYSIIYIVISWSSSI